MAEPDLRVRELRKHLFMAELDKAKDLIKDLDPSQDFGTDEEGLKLRSMAAEVCDYWGDFKRAREFIEKTAEECLREFTTEAPTGNWKYVKQKTWALLGGGMCAYRRASFDRAREFFTVADIAAKEVGDTSENPSWGLRARAQYSLGLVCREELKFKEAVTYFTQSTEWAYNSLEARGSGYSQLNYIPMARSLGMGLAFLHSTAGRPDLARPLLMAAKAMLPAQEKLISRHIDLIQTLVRAAAEQDEAAAVSDEILKRLQYCYQEFKALKHPLYLARAAYSLALVHVRRARPNEYRPITAAGDKELDAAAELTKDLIEYAQVSGDVRFRLAQLLIQSHIDRKRDYLDEAERKASEGLARAPNAFREYLDLLLARGEARVRKENTKGAIEDFEEGRERSKKGKVIQLYATFLLHLCVLYAKQSEARKASEYRARFENLRLRVMPSSIRFLAARADEALAQPNSDFILRLTDESIDPREQEKQFRRFLIRWAQRQRPGNDTKAAELLNITRQTLYNWLKS